MPQQLTLGRRILNIDLQLYMLWLLSAKIYILHRKHGDVVNLLATIYLFEPQ